MNMFALLIGLLACAIGYESTGDCTPHIRIQQADQKLTIAGACAAENGPANVLQYELIVNRIGASGTTRSKQGGTFTVGTSSADTLSTTTVNFVRGDSLHVRLLIYAGGQVVDSTEIRRTL